MKREIRLTADGSPTLYVPELDETYHSMHGSVQEAKHVFIENGLALSKGVLKNINVLEVGFGTGLNAFLSAQFAHEHQFNVQYTGIEAFPVEEAIWRELSYFQKPEEKALYHELMAATWEEPLILNANFTLSKLKTSVQDWKSSAFFDLIYFDAFGPRAQAEMWDKRIFEKLHTALTVGGMLVTYCAQGQFRRDLKAIGFEVLSLPGPPGKREMTRAQKI
ncbi:MAG: tRNA (5-methylaminomethyl-2-thiouridine)(34)-methyltransferase MnmD [Flavobacteriales bacterium]